MKKNSNCKQIIRRLSTNSTWNMLQLDVSQMMTVVTHSHFTDKYRLILLMH